MSVSHSCKESNDVVKVEVSELHVKDEETSHHDGDEELSTDDKEE